MGIFGIIQIICAVWVIIEVYKRTDKTNEQKIIWIVAAVILGIATAIVYYILEKKDKQI
ncbi:MAG TPA: PLDc N-terminal domain-containing protein [Bacteroidales bacterium]|jgi:ABC-type Mn2+/Zn2+ transport system permease subunit|nr:PLDc N-terminal domain-containing protein [Bacteroidales bacterium]HRS18564.1 PLDc N-terminal domain-containing protein [Bacteroidales bacterium]